MGINASGHQDHMGRLENVSRQLTGPQLNHVDFNGKAEPVATAMYGHGTDSKEHEGGSQRNVHTGGLPPWLDMCDEREKSLVNFGAQTNDKASPIQKEKSKKLNSKRVGAAWAEKRRIEIEMEKKGEIRNIVDANWLPNFGRVWQAGTRKESRKQFEIENHQLFKDGMHSGASLKLQPYISKRMRMGSSVEVAAVDPSTEKL